MTPGAPAADLSPDERIRAEGYMRQALRLARKATGRTWPNPMVGSLVVRGEQVVGRGYHHRAGLAHAEIEALAQAGPAARRADLFVTLEPCHCFGRTPPCTDAILRAGVQRVFVGACDPNPRECGAGLSVLQEAGLAVHSGILEAECLALNEVYDALIQHARPFVTVKAAISLDGRLAPRSGDARWISSKQSRIEAHRLRARCEALLVGIGTVRQDDPALNVRHVRGRDPAVVVLDSRLRLAPRARLLMVERAAPVWVYCSRAAPAARARRLERAGAEVIRVATRRGRLDLRAVLKDLLGRQAWRVLVEGGGSVIGALLETRSVDRLELAVAPILLGSEGVPLARWRGPARVDGAVRLDAMRVRRKGSDVYLSGRLAFPEHPEASAARRTPHA